MYLLHISPGHKDVAEYFIPTSGHPVQIRPRRTVKDAYTLPHPNEVQDQLAGSTNSQPWTYREVTDSSQYIWKTRIRQRFSLGLGRSLTNQTLTTITSVGFVIPAHILPHDQVAAFGNGHLITIDSCGPSSLSKTDSCVSSIYQGIP